MVSKLEYKLNDLKSPEDLPPRSFPYFRNIAFGRSLGVERRVGKSTWVARVLRFEGRRYFQVRLGPAPHKAATQVEGTLSFEEAVSEAKAWFDTRQVRAAGIELRPLSSRRSQRISR